MLSNFLALITAWFLSLFGLHPTPTVTPTPMPEPTVAIVATATPTRKPTPKPTLKPTSVPPTAGGPTSVPAAAAPSCNYQTSAASGSVKIEVTASSGYITGSPQYKLSAQSGCKVLDGNSTDSLTRFGSSPYSFSTVYPGTYNIEVTYNSNTTSTTVTVTSGQLSTVQVSLAGLQVTPTPAPARPTCNSPVVISTSGLSITIAPSSPMGYVDGFTTNWDWDGNGSWDTINAPLNTQTHTYSSAGTYTINMNIQDLSTYLTSDTCSTSTTVN